MVLLRKLPGWETELIRYVNEAQDRKLAYGVHDCVLWAAGAIRAVCGVDFIKHLNVPPYATEAEAIAILAQFGWVNLGEMLESLVAPAMKNPACVRSGDILLIPPAGPGLPDGGPIGMLGVAVGEAGIFLATDGLRSIPINPLLRMGVRVFPLR
jgi:hypothetical protein